ncbi:MAG: hypothetical protein ACRDZU_10525 [Acidimicrobiales bacterium]
MSPFRLPRWTALLVLPLLVGALLLMHGLDAGATTSGPHGAVAVASDHSHQDEAPAEHHDAGCDGCAIGHVMAACVAIVATVVGLRIAWRVAGPRLPTFVDTAIGSARAARQLLRPPDPVWVRLAVMRC